MHRNNRERERELMRLPECAGASGEVPVHTWGRAHQGKRDTLHASWRNTQTHIPSVGEMLQGTGNHTNNGAQGRRSEKSCYPCFLAQRDQPQSPRSATHNRRHSGVIWHARRKSAHMQTIPSRPKTPSGADSTKLKSHNSTRATSARSRIAQLFGSNRS